MKKIKITCLILAIVLVTSGGVIFVVSNSSSAVVPPEVVSDSTMLDRPASGNPSNYDAIENLYIANGELMRCGGFKGQARGTSVSMGITQDVMSNRTVVGNNAYKQSVSIGAVKMATQVYLWGDSYLIRSGKAESLENITWDAEPRSVSKESYADIYGYRYSGLSGYVLTDETITEGKLESENNGVYRYRYVLDNTLATAKILYEMRTNAGTRGFASFTRAEIIVEMDSEWKILTFTTDCDYNVPILTGVPCHENITETFSDWGYKGDLPQKEYFERYFDATVTEPVPAEPDTLSVLLDVVNSALVNGKLNASITATVNGTELLNGLICANVDVAHLENIAVDAKLGEGLYLSYVQNKIFVSYGDFRGSVTIDGIMGFVKTLGVDTGKLDFDTDKLTESMTHEMSDGVLTVTIPLPIDEATTIDAFLYADVAEDGSYSFAGAKVGFGDVVLEVKPHESWDVPEKTGDYPEILGLTEIIENGAISADIAAGDVKASLTYKFDKKALAVESGDLSATYQNDALYARLGELKVKMNISDIQVLTSLAEKYLNVKLPETQSISLEQIVSLLNGINASATDNGVSFALSAQDISVNVNLVDNGGKWNVGVIVVNYKGTSVYVTPNSDELTIPQVKDEEYADVTALAVKFAPSVMALVNGKNYEADADLSVSTDGSEYRLTGKILVDADKNVNADATLFVDGVKVKCGFVLAEKVAYVNINGVKVAVAAGSGVKVDSKALTSVLSSIYGKNESLDKIIDKISSVSEKVVSLDVKSIDFADLIKDFRFENGKLYVTANLDMLDLGQISVVLSTKLGQIVLDVENYSMLGATLNAKIGVNATGNKVVAPNADDYVLRLKGEAANLPISISADLLNMDVCADIDILNDTLKARFVNNGIYAKLGNVALYAEINDVMRLISDLSQKFALQGTADFDLQSLLNGIKVDLTSDTPNISLNTEQFAVAINFTKDGEFTDISASLGGYSLTLKQTEEDVAKLDLNGDFTELTSLAAYALNLFDTYRNVNKTGISAELNLDAEVNGKTYSVSANVKYNKGLYLALNIASEKQLVNAELYYVNNAVYIDVNGVRASGKLPEASSEGSALTADKVIAVLQKAKGYNDILDSVIDGAQKALGSLGTLDVIELVDGLTFGGGILTADLNLEQLGMGKTSVTVEGTNKVTADKLSLGGVSVNNVSVTADAVCGEVCEPTESYVTTLCVNVADITAYVQLDLYNRTVKVKTTLLNTELNALYAEGSVYVTFGNVNAKIALSDLPELIKTVTSAFDVNIGFDASAITVKDIIDSITFAYTDGGYSIGLTAANVPVVLDFAETDGKAVMTGVNVSYNGTAISANLVSGIDFAEIDTNGYFVDLTDVVNSYLDSVVNVINAKGYAVTLDAYLTMGTVSYRAVGSVNYVGGNVSVDADLYAQGVRILDLGLTVENNVLFLDVNGLKLAMRMSAFDWNKVINQIRGADEHLDSVINLAYGVLEKINDGSLDFVALIKSLTFYGGKLDLQVCGTQINTSDFGLTVNADGGLNIALDGLNFNGISLDLKAGVQTASESITAPSGDYSTNLQIIVDERNTIHANLDLINNVFLLRLDDLNVLVSNVKTENGNLNGTLKITDGKNIFVTCDFSSITEIIDKVYEIIGDNAQDRIDLDLGKILGGFDIKALIGSLGLYVDNYGGATITLSALGQNVALNIDNGGATTFNCVVPVDALSKTLIISGEDKQDYYDFENDVNEYVSIESVLDSFFPAIEQLVLTHAWHFDMSAQIDVADANNPVSYRVNSGSFIDVLYEKSPDGNKKNDLFELRGKLILQKKDASANDFTDFMTLQIVYVEGRIYVDYNGLKLSVSTDAINECVGLVDELLRVVPQIKEAIDKMQSTMKEAQENAELVSYATILQSFWYTCAENGPQLGLSVNGGVFLPDRLSDIVLEFGRISKADGDGTVLGLALNKLELSYDNVSINNVNVAVTPQSNETAHGNICGDSGYNINDYHINLDSIPQLLQSFVITADKRSFYIDGTLTANIHLGSWNLSDIKMPMSVKVDIDEDGKVFVAAKVSRTAANINILGIKMNVYEDRGGDSYLYFNGADNTFAVIRNSYADYCTKSNSFNCSKWHIHSNEIRMREREYLAENIDEKTFTANIMDYIFEIFNFNNTLENLIRDQINKDSGTTGEFKIEQVLTDYKYLDGDQVADKVTENDVEIAMTGDYQVKVDLNSVIGVKCNAAVDIFHDGQYQLRKLKLQIGMLDIIDANLDMALKPTEDGVAETIVTQYNTDGVWTYWR